VKKRPKLTQAAIEFESVRKPTEQEWVDYALNNNKPATYVDEIFDMLPDVGSDDPRWWKAMDLCDKLLWPMAVWDTRYRIGFGLFAIGVLVGWLIGGAL